MNKTQNNDEEFIELSNNFAYINDEDIMEEILMQREEIHDKRYFKKIIFVFSIYFLSQIFNDYLNNLGFNNLKLWPLESILIYL